VSGPGNLSGRDAGKKLRVAKPPRNRKDINTTRVENSTKLKAKRKGVRGDGPVGPEAHKVGRRPSGERETTKRKKTGPTRRLRKEHRQKASACVKKAGTEKLDSRVNVQGREATNKRGTSLGTKSGGQGEPTILPTATAWGTGKDKEDNAGYRQRKKGRKRSPSQRIKNSTMGRLPIVSESIAPEKKRRPERDGIS